MKSKSKRIVKKEQKKSTDPKRNQRILNKAFGRLESYNCCPAPAEVFIDLYRLNSWDSDIPKFVPDGPEADDILEYAGWYSSIDERIRRHWDSYTIYKYDDVDQIEFLHLFYNNHCPELTGDPNLNSACWVCEKHKTVFSEVEDSCPRNFKGHVWVNQCP